MNLFSNTDYAFTGLLYKIFEFEPFRTYLEIDLNNGLIDQRPIRNISILTQMIARFDYLQHIDVFTPKRIIKDVETLVIGGLVQEEDKKNTGKLPILGDIPVLGMFFRSSSNSKVPLFIKK